MNTFILIALAVIILASLALFFYAKRLASGEPANASLLLMVKWPLLLASAGFNCFFTYNVFSTFNEAVAI
ncbi:hypothetical protein, partial [uncultured Thiothrix sp.]|uniref:hypothetical protein n=1 Tax=uncultured Thiothrix sp. TaxID=223185 RepID=UPI00262EE20F